jgi:hypothetical protein
MEHASTRARARERVFTSGGKKLKPFMLITFRKRKKSVETSNICWLAKHFSFVY